MTDMRSNPRDDTPTPKAYVRHTARQTELESVAISRGVLRKEMGLPVDGLVVTLSAA